ncbi:helix-turn-helix domain-containing protein [Variovorax guangxiensis]|uniref:AraC-like ligand-binding domain-containing protein n=1 Tax=Variovorax guangxiensis TaxID=1775474 RepID=UPI002859D962|nr:helix-turn-helix domain-containing protein [Variovorax guangxiensis]MDR6856613.1 AraC-like DNA-binding protein [Variovorax guangxiensis]
MEFPHRQWSTDAVPGSQRLDYWVGAVCEAFLEMDVTSSRPEGFDASLLHQPLGPIAVNRVRASAQDVYRTHAAIGRSRHNFYYLISQFDRPWGAAQGGRSAALAAGDAVLVDSRERYEFHFREGVHCASMQLPIDWVERWLPAGPDGVARRIPGDAGWGLALRGLLHNLSPEFAAKPGLPPALIVDQLGVLLSLAVPGPAEGPEPQAASLRRLATDLLRQRLGEPGLTGQGVADALGASLRSLHRAFAPGESFARTLRRLRMEEAARLLAAGRFARLGVAEIGRRCGYLDASHFVRHFRAEHGLTPGAWRRSLAGAPG